MGNNDNYRSRYKKAYRHSRNSARIRRARFKFILSSVVIVAVIVGSTTWMLKHKRNENPVDVKPQMDVSSQVDQSGVSSAQQNTVVSSRSGGAAESTSSSNAQQQGTSFEEWNKTCDWKLLVVNYNNKIPDGYTVETKDMSGMQVGTRIYSAVEQMRNAASEDGIVLWISSAYRSNELQKQLYDNEVSDNIANGYSKTEAEKIAATAVAVPGTSEHSTGLAVDLNEVSEDFEDTAAYKWLSQHAADYGFVQRYSEDKQDITHIIYEPWHYRYVGVANAKEMDSKHMCLEEYVEYLMNRQ